MHTKTNQSYRFSKPMTEHQILEKAAEIVATKFISSEGDAFTNVGNTKDFLSFKLANYEREVFAVMLLNTQHQLIEYRELFFGTIDSASVHPREVVKVALEVNASAIIFAHNHPSGIAEPSESDKRITKRLTDALGLIDVRVLDHVVVGRTPVSFLERGLI